MWGRSMRSAPRILSKTLQRVFETSREIDISTEREISATPPLLTSISGDEGSESAGHSCEFPKPRDSRKCLRASACHHRSSSLVKIIRSHPKSYHGGILKEFSIPISAFPEDKHVPGISQSRADDASSAEDCGPLG